MRYIAAAVMLLTLAGITHGQTIIEPIQEYGHKVNGDFTVRNDGLHVLDVVIKPLGFSMAGGKDVYSPIETTAKLQVKQPVFKLGAMQQHMVSFKAECIHLPCAFKLFAEITDPSQTTFKTVLRLPAVIYSCDRQSHCRRDMLASWAAK